MQSHLSEVNSRYKVLQISILSGSSTTVTGFDFDLPFHRVNETVDSWVNQHTPIDETISLPEILHRQTFTLQVEATNVEINHKIRGMKACKHLANMDTVLSKSGSTRDPSPTHLLFWRLTHPDLPFRER